MRSFLGVLVLSQVSIDLVSRNSIFDSIPVPLLRGLPRPSFYRRSPSFYVYANLVSGDR